MLLGHARPPRQQAFFHSTNLSEELFSGLFQPWENATALFPGSVFPEAIIPYKRRSEGPFAGSYDPEEVFEDIVRASKGSDADLTGMLEVKERDGVGLYEQLRRLRERDDD